MVFQTRLPSWIIILCCIWLLRFAHTGEAQAAKEGKAMLKTKFISRFLYLEGFLECFAKCKLHAAFQPVPLLPFLFTQQKWKQRECYPQPHAESIHTCCWSELGTRSLIITDRDCSLIVCLGRRRCISCTGLRLLRHCTWCKALGWFQVCVRVGVCF